MKKVLVLFLCLMLQLLFSQKREDGPYKNYYDSGELFIEGQYKNEKRIGEWKQYHKNGQISKIYSYKDGELNKEEINYYDTAEISSKVIKVENSFIRYGYYKSGKLEYERQLNSGYYKSFYENGELEIEANYIDNELSGKWKLYDTEGNLKWIITYEDGYRHGIYQQFYKNGKLKLEGLMLRDKKEGAERRYDENEVVVWKGYYEKDEFAKTWIKYDKNGKKAKKIRIKGDPSVLNLKTTSVPDGVLEKVPLYPGCEEVFGNRARKRCMSKAVSQFISRNFNTDLELDANLKGRQRIILFFKIDKEGNVTNASSKAPHPVLQKEAIRVINILQKMRPAYQKGKPVVIPFSIPIVFTIY